jgi:hypothetical protein
VAWWKVYFRRFAGDQGYRFAKQSLRWTLPHFKTPEQAEGWSDLLPFMLWELWLARPLVTEKTLPWQKPMRRLSPGRVRQSLGAIFAPTWPAVSTPRPFLAQCTSDDLGAQDCNILHSSPSVNAQRRRR